MQENDFKAIEVVKKEMEELIIKWLGEGFDPSVSYLTALTVLIEKSLQHSNEKHTPMDLVAKAMMTACDTYRMEDFDDVQSI